MLTHSLEVRRKKMNIILFQSKCHQKECNYESVDMNFSDIIKSSLKLYQNCHLAKKKKM